MKKILLNGKHEIDFDPNEDIEFLFSETLPYHPNALTFLAAFKNELGALPTDDSKETN